MWQQKFPNRRSMMLWRTFVGRIAGAPELFYGNVIGTAQLHRRNCRTRSLILCSIKRRLLVAVALTAKRALRTRLRGTPAWQAACRPISPWPARTRAWPRTAASLPSPLVAEESVRGQGGRDRYELVYLNVTSSSMAIPHATVKLRIDGEEVVGHGTGDGMVDACYRVISDLTA